ncbi:lipid-binding SYLF domain-containing protein [uncultured Massilia sp.]|uniref:lipid-binding SYLF domain-containing protein n=1 Tax=uncultured Massilia sp. TaxID=169973 RepID=UPI0025F99774|nr:lipid-binding SYLF domain-containing protein [uncultured Massilia sp.]
MTPTTVFDRLQAGCRRRAAAAATLAFLCGAVPPALAQDTPPQAGTGTAAPAAPAAPAAQGDADARHRQAAARHVDNAARIARTLAATPRMADLLAGARGVYIVPRYGRAAVAVGAAGGAGVLVARRADGSWGDPAFFNLGGLGIGLQVGVEGGPIAFLLMNQRAVDSFRNRNNFSLSADAGLTVVNYARMAQGSTSGDVIAWSGTKGLFGNAATLAVNDIRYNQRLTDAYYGRTVSAMQTIDSAQTHPQADGLRQALGGAKVAATTR